MDHNVNIPKYEICIALVILFLSGNVRAAPLISIEEAVDNSALNFTSGGDAAWFGQNNVSYFGGDAAQAGTISHSQSTWIQTNVTNVDMLSFFWKVSSESRYDFLEFYIDDMLKDTISGEVNWTRKTYDIGSGNHTLKWIYRKDVISSAGNDTGWIDRIEFLPWVSLQEAVDNSAFNFTSGGDAPWFGQDAVSYFGGDSAQSGRLSYSQSSWIRTNVTDIGILSFYWKFSSKENLYNRDFLAFYIDGVQQDSISQEVNWTQKKYSIGAGTHTLMWMYSNYWGRADTAGWIDKIEFSPSLPLEEAVDNTALNFTSGGDAPWFGQDAVSYFGGDAAQSGRISQQGQSTWIQTNVTDIGMLSFYWKFSSKEDYRDFLSFYIDGVQQDSISGEANWTQKNYSIGSGSHTLIWKFTKYWTSIDGTGWIDKIEFSPSLPLEEAVDNTALNFTSGGDAPWFGQDAVSYFGGDAAQSGRISQQGQSTWIQTNVTDIGILSFYWKVSSYDYRDFLAFYIDGVELDRIGREANWTKKKYSIGAGNHTLMWKYNSYFGRTGDAGWIDEIEVSLNISHAHTNKLMNPLKENVTISCIVLNETKGITTVDNITARILKPDFSIEWITLAEGSTGNYQGLFKNTSLFGTYYVMISANKTGYINGSTELSFEVNDEHDITITNIDAPSSPLLNSEIFLNATVRNSGLNNESEITVDFIVDGVNRSNKTISFLKSGSYTNISFQWKAPGKPGMHNMTFYIRPVVNESIISNNRFNWSVSVVIGSITWLGKTDQNETLWFDVGVSTGLNYEIERIGTRIICYVSYPPDLGFYFTNINVPIIDDAFNINGVFRGTFITPTYAVGVYSVSQAGCIKSGTWEAYGYFPDLPDFSEALSITTLTNLTYAPTYINFTWTNPSDPDYHHVMLYLNGTFLTNIMAPQNYCNVTGLTPDTEYELGTHTVDSSGNINQTWINKTARTAPPDTEKIIFTLPLKIGWNMVSLPIIPDDPSVIAIFGSNVTTVYGWTGTQYLLSSTLEPKNGYWVLSSSNYDITVTGTPVFDRDITLTRGWKIVGPVTNRIMVSSLQNVTTVYEWTGTSYNIVSGSNTLTLTKGYWILGNATSNIQV